MAGKLDPKRRGLFLPPAFPEDAHQTAQAKLLHPILFCGLSACLLLPFLVSPSPHWKPLYHGLSLVCALFFLAALAVLRRGRVATAFCLALFGPSAILVWVLFQLGGVHSPLFQFAYVIVLTVGLFLGRRACLLAILAVALVGLALVWAEKQGAVRPVPSDSLVVWAVFLLVLSILVIGMRECTAALRGALAESQREIAARRGAEEAQARADKHFRQLFENFPIGVYRTTPEGRFVFGNLAVARLLGASSPAELLAMHIEQDGLETSESREAFKKQVEATGAVHGLESVWTRLDGTAVCVRENAVAVRGDDGRVLFYEGAVEDVTSHRRTTDQLTVLGHAIRSINECVVICDMENKILFVNNAFEEVYGYRADEVVGRAIDMLRDVGDNHDSVPKVLSDTVDNGWRGELINIRKDGSRFPIELSATTVRDEAGRAIATVGVFTDITDRKRAEEERLRLENQLLQSQKMETIGRLAGGVAHDFNNLLAPIIGYADLLLQECPLTDPRHEFLHTIRESGERAAQLTRRLLSFSQQQLIELRVDNLNRIIEGFRKILSRTLREEIALNLDLQTDLGNVRVDANQVEQILLNLAVNSQDAMPGRGTIFISTRNMVNGRHSPSAAPDREPESWVRLTVRDTGCGIAPANLDRIFDPFFSTKEKGKGTGLGLAIVYGIVRQHGGAISVSSDPGEGATFHIDLPRVPLDVAEMGGDGPVRAPLLGNEAVVVVEDNAEVRRLTCHILRSLGYDVTEIGDPGECLELFRAKPGAARLLLTDVIMPGMNGRELYSAVSRCAPAVKVLYMSGYADQVIDGHSPLEEGVHFIQKPFRPGDLAVKVREALQAP